MNLQELRNLQEAYLEVVDFQQLDEISSSVIARTELARQENLHRAQDRENAARNANANMEVRSNRAAAVQHAAKKVSRNHQLGVKHAAFRIRQKARAANELDEGAEGGRFEYNQRHGRPLITPEVSQSRSSQETLGGGTYVRGPKRLPKSKRKYDRQVLSGVRAASEQEKERARKRMGIKEDIYDIILSHLLDEGYADTQEQAEVIMVNMSEEWRDSIIG